MAAAPLLGDEPMEMGPARTREMFPLYQIGMVYQPSDPTPVGKGRLQVALEHMRANTFEFSDVFKEQPPEDVQGRIHITQASAGAIASRFADIPLIFYFDEEIVRTALHLRYGLTDRTDLWADVVVTSSGGGYLDGLIEAFHKLGFEQFGRDRIARNQVGLLVVDHGKIVFFTDHGLKNKLNDPLFGINHRILDEGPWRLSVSVSMKPPMTTTYGVYRTGWDQSYAVTGRFEPTANSPGPAAHVFYFGAGFVRRPRGSPEYNSFPEGRFRDGVGAHLGWEYRGSSRIRPFVQLYWQSPFLCTQPYQKLDHPSLQHDLGFHWQSRPRTVWSLHYLNNITHNENTADMGLGLTLSHRF